MGKVELIVDTGSKLVGEAQGVVEVDTFTSAIVVQQELVLEATDLLGRSDFVVLSRNRVLHVGDVLTATEPASSVLLELVARPDARLHAGLVEA
jgi:hypothetical protein